MSDNTYKLLVTAKAAYEFKKAYVWYEEQQEGLGGKLEAAVNDKLKKICKNPYHYNKTYKNFQEALIDKFPFIIVYIIKEKKKEILIMAIFHTSRNPKAKHKK